MSNDAVKAMNEALTIINSIGAAANQLSNFGTYHQVLELVLAAMKGTGPNIPPLPPRVLENNDTIVANLQEIWDNMVLAIQKESGVELFNPNESKIGTDELRPKLKFTQLPSEPKDDGLSRDEPWLN